MDQDLVFDETLLVEKYPFAFKILLADRSSGRNILWCTDTYKKEGYSFFDEITEDVVLSKKIIIPRSAKTRDEQVVRAQVNGEVFTPSWMCNLQNNLYDNDWFEKNNVFNTPKNKRWNINKETILFPDGKTFIDYIKSNRIEITCGEAPYIVSRYDTVSGKTINPNERIGILDRKFRVINENSNDDDWATHALEAIKATFGFEWQGDNLFLARENVLLSFVEYYFLKFFKLPSNELVEEVSNVISWNLWQMDGLKYVIPCSCKNIVSETVDIFGTQLFSEKECIGCKIGNNRAHTGIYCLIMDWEKNQPVRFIELVKGI